MRLNHLNSSIFKIDLLLVVICHSAKVFSPKHAESLLRILIPELSRKYTISRATGPN